MLRFLRILLPALLAIGAIVLPVTIISATAPHPSKADRACENTICPGVNVPRQQPGSQPTKPASPVGVWRIECRSFFLTRQPITPSPTNRLPYCIDSSIPNLGHPVWVNFGIVGANGINACQQGTSRLLVVEFVHGVKVATNPPNPVTDSTCSQFQLVLSGTTRVVVTLVPILGGPASKPFSITITMK